jgi:hypothetical protein
MQSDQTSRIQLTLADVVQKLAMEPRQRLMLQDSVLVQDAPSISGRNSTKHAQATQRNHEQYLTDLFD